ncbi:metallophosphoesterase [Pyrococcus kukulkanii]|uniref:Phosphoesterase n=1 Tax=Pyrococcus kukulkanii TaxID=1609559 RepID=A0A127BAT6_9EURY|nr:metallophosphoesterase [Pyrococcus kukulkanii]AMM54433.1 3',5'-cyclic-nucleotide phosphodiesterase [Pyrococcus kukulkanii]
MLIGVISDTHFPKAYFPDKVKDFFKKKGVKYIVHAGDVQDKALIEILEEVAPVIAVKGNADSFKLPEEEVLRVFDWNILIIHGHQFLSLSSQNLVYKALEEGADILVFGHTHRPYYNEASYMGKRVILINPGSPTLPRLSEPSFAVLNLSKEDVDVKFYNVWML